MGNGIDGNGEGGADPRLERVRVYIQERLSEDISLRSAARIAALEETYFSTLFKRTFGINFRDWLCQLRIRRAQELISSHDYSITEVAYQVGFSNLRSFERAFKRMMETTPSEFRHSQQAVDMVEQVQPPGNGQSRPGASN